MKQRWAWLCLLTAAGLISASCLSSLPYGGGYDTGTDPAAERYSRLAGYAADLESRSGDIVDAVSGQVIDQFGSWSDDQISVLFASEGFAASCRTFRRLVQRGQGGPVRQGLDRALRFVVRDFDALESSSRLSGIRLYPLTECVDILRRIERELGVGSSFDDFDRDRPTRPETGDWEGKYVRGRDASVYLIERAGGAFVRRPFKNLESLFKYNYDQDRGGNPWDSLVEIPANQLDRMRNGAVIERTFEGLMIIEQGTKPNRSVYLIRNGEKKGLTRPELVARYGGWKKVFEVPREIIDGYKDGEPIR